MGAAALAWGSVPKLTRMFSPRVLTKVTDVASNISWNINTTNQHLF
jgi:hypothetical protein